MTRILRRTLLLACVAAAVTAAAFVHSASANYLGSADITCTSVTFHYSTFPSGTQSMLETVFVDGAIATQVTRDFVGPSGTDTVQITVPTDGQEHYVEAYGYSITNSTTVLGFPAVATLTCGSPQPPPPPPSPVCTYTKGYYKNHASVTSSVIASMGGTIKVGGASLTASQAQGVLEGSNVGYAANLLANPNLLLNLVQQLITAELNVARGSTASAAVQSAISQGNAAISVTPGGSSILLSSALSTANLSGFVVTLDHFNFASDCV